MKLEFDPYALEDFRHWVATDRKRVPKTLKRIEDILRCAGTGKPEPLKCILAGCWPQLVDQTHRLVYKLEDDTAVILSCRYHY